MTAPTVRIEILTLDDDGAQRVDVLESNDHTADPDADEAPSSGVFAREAP